jgi:16S rRNA processing protein RimM
LTEDYFDIGVIVSVHGLKGEVRVKPITDDPSRFGLLDVVEIFFDNKPSSESYPLKSARPHKTLMVLKLEGVDDRNAAEKLVGGIIKVPRSRALPLGENEYYQKDLLEMTVVTDTGEKLGHLVQVIETGANDVYVVRPLSDVQANTQAKDILIPAIKECILDVSLEEAKMTVHLMEGLR